MKTTNNDSEQESTKEFETASGIPLKEIYGPSDIAGIDFEKDVGAPGEYPFVRGLYPGMYRKKLWTMRMLSGFGSAKDSLERLKYLASIGSQGIEVTNDQPSQIGIDADHPVGREEAGLIGIPVSSLYDLETMLEGFPLDKTTISFESSGASGPVLPCQLFALAENQNVPLSALNGSAHLNPFDQFYGPFEIPQPLDLWTKLAVDVTEFCARKKMRFVPFHTSAHAVSEAGTPAVHELALGMWTKMAFADKLVERGLNFDEFAARPVMTLSIFMDFYEEIAKFRAARKIWARIARERYGSKNPRAQRLYLAVRASGLTAIAQQPLNNIMRIAYQLLAAALGGCNAIDPVLLDEPLCIPTEFSTWLGMCNQSILANETGVPGVVDPMAGSYLIESLTAEIEKRTFEMIRKIEDMGGFVEAVKSGWVKALVEEDSLKRQKAIESGEMKVVGINDMVIPPEKEFKVPIHETTRASVEEQVKRTIEKKKTRDNKAVRDILKKLVVEDNQGNVNLTATLIEACKAYATIGEIWGSLRQGRGLSYDPFNMIESPFKD